MQEKLEASRAGRLLLSAFVIVTVGSLVVWNLPGSKLREEGMRVARPYVYATGLDQNWGVFAPNPRSVTMEMYARVTYADDSHRIWHVPSGGPVLGAYWDFRWRKFVEWATQDANKDLWPLTADFVAREEIDAGRRPVRVELVRRWHDILAPGSNPARGPWREYRFFTARFTPEQSEQDE
jgi:hypothetical protein